MTEARPTTVSLSELLAPSQVNAPASRERGKPGWPLRIAIVALVAGALLAVVAAIFWLSGGRWMIVATPSMGQAAPVGTLVLTEPVSVSDVRVGDIISFRSPLVPSETYTHRVVSIDSAGGLHTKGDINGGADPAILREHDLVGKVVARWWGVGWMLRALPFLLVGSLVLWFGTRLWASDRWRLPLRVFGGSVLVSVSALLLRPFVNMVQFAAVPTARGVDLTLVSTGVLPIRVTGTGGHHVDLIDGQIGVVSGTGTPGPHGYQFTAALHLSWGWWAVLVLIWLVPLLIAVLFAPRLPAPDDGDGPADTGRAARLPLRGRHSGRPRRSVGRTAGSVAVIVAAVAAGSFPSTASAFAAKVTNSVNTAASNTYFTCRAAAVSTALNGGYLAFGMTDASTGTATDTSGNSRNGTYVGVWSAAASGPCIRDTAGAATVGGTQSYISTPPALLAPVADPEVFSVQIWFKTGTAGGRLIGFGNLQTGTSTSYDRHIYMTNSGQLVFGVYPGAVKIITSPKSYSDNVWHQTVATLSSNGMKLYVDGALVASDATTTSAEAHSGWWRVGYDNLNAWTNQPTNSSYIGSLAWASVYTTELPASTVLADYIAAK